MEVQVYIPWGFYLNDALSVKLSWLQQIHCSFDVILQSIIYLQFSPR
jgi:hypothetical protein